MNIFKFVLILLTGTGFGVGVDKLANSDIAPNDQDQNYDYMDEDNRYFQNGFCHDDEDFFEHMLDDLSEEDKAIVEAKIDALLLEYSIDLENLYDNELRFDFMSDLMDFLDENDIDYHHFGSFSSHDDDDYHHGMGMH